MKCYSSNKGKPLIFGAAPKQRNKALTESKPVIIQSQRKAQELPDFKVAPTKKNFL